MTKFSDLKLDPKVLQAIAEAGYETPTPIQAGAIPPALEGRDVLGIAQTGTGKTASFTLPMITLLGRGRARARMPRSLVLCPTRELAAQVAENFDIYAKHTRLTKALLIGGVSFGEQDKLIDRGVDVLIATPGRLLDHFERGKLLLTGVQIMVVDEADRMLDMGFIPDIERIFQLTPFTRQTLFFSATMAPEIERITNTFLHAPERIEVARQATASETITQKLVELETTRRDQTAKQKRELLRALIVAEGEALKNAIIFCNRKTEVDIVAKSLKAHGFDAAPIHGDLDQRVRMATLDGFREGTLRFLIASDVAARGLDIPAVSHVFNFDLPSHAEDYVHRIGRTGRAGRLGTAISIATPSDEKYLAAIENLVKQTLPRAPAPEGFALSDAAQSAPRERVERPRGERGERGSRSRSRGERNAQPEVQPAAPAADRLREEPQVREAAAVGEDRRGREDRPTREDRSGREDRPERAAGAERAGKAERLEKAERSDKAERSAREDRAERPARDERGDRRDRHRDRDRGPAVLGMGEHVPDFMTTSFAEAIAVTDARVAASAQRAPVAVPTLDAAEEASPAEPRSRARRARGGRKVSAAAEQLVTDQAASEANPDDLAAPVETITTAEGAAAEPAAALEPAAAEVATKPRRSRARRKPADAPLPEEREAEAPQAAAAPPAEPAASVPAPGPDALPEERAAADAVADGRVGAAAPNSTDAADAPVKPKRARAPRKPRAKTPAAEGAADEPSAAPAAQAVPVGGAEAPDTPADPA